MNKNKIFYSLEVKGQVSEGRERRAEDGGLVGKGEEWTNKKQSKEKVRSFERGLVVRDLYKNFEMNCLDGHQVIIDYQRCRAPAIFVEYITPDKIQVRSTVIL